MEFISHLDLLNVLAQRRMTLVNDEASFVQLEAAIFGLQERDALDYDMLKSVLAPYANTAIDLDEDGGPVEDDVGFDVLDLIIDTVSPEAFEQLELMIPDEDELEEEYDEAWEAYWELKHAIFFAIMELHFAVFEAV